MQSEIDGISSAVVSVRNCINTVLNLIKSNVNGKIEQETAVT